MNIQTKICLGLGIAGVLFGSQTVTAQSQETNPSQGGLMEEVVVTAERRETRLQDVPLSITAFDSVALEKIRFNDVKDIIDYTPSVNFALPPDSRHELTVHMRGVQSRGSADPGVGVYYDDIYMGARSALDANLMDIARVEVLAGPQGTLYGRNTIGGAIKFVTKKPTGEWGLQQNLQFGEYGHFKSTEVAPFFRTGL